MLLLTPTAWAKRKSAHLKTRKGSLILRYKDFHSATWIPDQQFQNLSIFPQVVMLRSFAKMLISLHPRPQQDKGRNGAKSRVKPGGEGILQEMEQGDWSGLDRKLCAINYISENLHQRIQDLRRGWSFTSILKKTVNNQECLRDTFECSGGEQPVPWHESNHTSLQRPQHIWWSPSTLTEVDGLSFCQNSMWNFSYSISVDFLNISEGFPLCHSVVVMLVLSTGPEYWI